MFSHESMQQALQQVQQVCNDTQKKKFSDLFSLLDSNDEPEVSSGNRRPARGQGSKRAATTNRSTNTSNNSNRSNSKKSNKDESEEESSEDEVYMSRPKQAKMRRKAPVGSDSD